MKNYELDSIWIWNEAVMTQSINYPCICLETLRKTTENLRKYSRVSVEFRTEVPQELYCYTHLYRF
jgi:hypothetical protein